MEAEPSIWFYRHFKARPTLPQLLTSDFFEMPFTLHINKSDALKEDFS